VSADKPGILAAMSALAEEPLDVRRVIVDPHHHLWDFGIVPGMAQGSEPFLLPDMLTAVNDSGHRVMQTVYVECHAMYRQHGPKEMMPIGETEFANGAAAMSASGRYGECRIAAGIVGSADLRLGGKVVPVIEAQIAAGNGRFRGIRTETAYAEASLFGRPTDPALKGVMLSPAFREGVLALSRFGLTLDVWCLHTQLAELIELASACPEVQIILDHLGTPPRAASDRRRTTEVASSWRRSLKELARRPNVRLKLGGLGMELDRPIDGRRGAVCSHQLAREWRPYVEAGIEAFGPARCMFESNFPPDRATCSYGALWNAFKLTTAAYSEDEKNMLFSGTAEKVYRLL
jgi:predicted TIM-barrel fold metal-dependent hydrolase